MSMFAVRTLALLLTIAIAACAPAVKEAPPSPAPPAVSYPVVGGAPMDPRRSIIDNLRQSHDHRTLVAALDAAGLAERLSQAGSLTLFAPTDAAFALLPTGTVEALMHPRTRPDLARILNYHLLMSSREQADILADVRAGGGRASYPTAAGAAVVATMAGDRIILTDASGRRAAITQADVAQANGTLHVIDAVLLPPAS